MYKDQTAARVRRIIGRVAGFLPATHYAVFGSVGAVVALAPQANATPILSPAANVVIPVTTAGIYINVVTGVTNIAPASVIGWDMNPFSTTSLNWFNPTSPAGGVYMRGTSTTPGNQPLGTLVDTFANYGSGSSTFGGAATQWQFNATNYIGFRFLNEADTLIHYGWASVLVGATAIDPVRSVQQIYYESQANTGITVGDTGSGVPEPSTAALLAAGAMGLLALRRRRQ